MIHSFYLSNIRWAAAAAAIVFMIAPVAAQPDEADAKSLGVGLKERKADPDLPLKLVFSTTEGPLVANVEVRITDDSGKTVFETDAADPWLFVDLPAGDYDIRAKRSTGAETSAKVTIPGEGQETVVLSFPAESRS